MQTSFQAPTILLSAEFTYISVGGEIRYNSFCFFSVDTDFCSFAHLSVMRISAVLYRIIVYRFLCVLPLHIVF